MPTASSTFSQAEKAVARCQAIARFSEDREGTRRTFLSPPMRECHREIAQWLQPLGVSAKLDAAGNLRALYPGATQVAPRLVIGSHLDTVPNAGAFDGVLGVALAVALVESLEARRLPFGIEVVGFSEEEGVRFGIPFVGSRALVGRLDEELLQREDANGVSVRHAIVDFGLDPERIPQACVGSDVMAFLEFHIEQGPVLDEIGVPLGIVETIAGQSRLQFCFAGETNHAGTTPMHLRRDALAGAAEWIAAVENAARSSSRMVATVGAIEAKPGVINAIAGETSVSLDVRHASDKVRKRTVADLIQQGEAIAKRRDLRVQWRTLLDQRAVAMAPAMLNQLAEAVRKAGCEPHRMVSGAGHDAMILAERVPAAMVFLRTPAGVSHHPSETVRVADVAKAIECGMHLLEQLAQS